ncbi:hypothetical protein SRHO_G00039930 [Serrasalmus rhombeus]
MDNCDLEKLLVDGVKLCPPFQPEITLYTATVPSNISTVTLDLLTSDCGASYRILCGDGSRTVKLEDGLNQVDVEVTSEDGTLKKYSIELTKLLASEASLSALIIKRQQLHPAFSPDTHEYSCQVNFDRHVVTVEAQVPDHNMQVTVKEACSSGSVRLNVGDTLVTVNVSSPDGTNSQVYTILITQEQIPLAVSFCEMNDQMEFECPVSLSALYRPFSINQSDPKAVFSAPYIDMLTRRSKVHPFTDRPLGDSWKVPESELNNRMSSASVKCFFAHRGCESVLKLAEIGAHAKGCPNRPPVNLDTKEVTEMSWYKKHFTSSRSLEIETKHCLQVRNWEKRLQTAVDEGNIDDLCGHAESQIKLYQEQLPKPGDMMQYEAGHSPLDYLEQAAIHYATAIKFKPRDYKLHFLLGKTLEEYYYATEMYGLKKRVLEEDDQNLNEAQTTGRQEEILAICRLHGFLGTPTVENQLKALDKEFHQLKEQGQSGKADYVQTLFIWLSKKVGKDCKAGVCDEEGWLHRAFLKYLDAWSLSPEKWELNLQVGRLLLLQGKSREALQHLLSALALAPSQAVLRFYMGLAILQQDGVSVEEEREAILFLQQGLEYVMDQYFTSPDQDREQKQDAEYALSTVNVQFLRGCLSLGALLSKHMTSGQKICPVLVYHTVALFAARAVSMCVGWGELIQQLEWVLLDAHFALLEVLMQQQSMIRQVWIAQRCQALTALIRLACIAPCRELLDMQEKVCEVGVMTTPRSSTALCLLGLSQLAQYDSDPSSESGQAAMADACLSFQASIALEGSELTGDPPEQLTKQKWWRDHLAKEKKKTDRQASVKATEAAGPPEATAAGRAAGRGIRAVGRGGATAKSAASAPARGVRTAAAAKQSGQTARGAAAKSDGGGKSPAKASSKTQLFSCKSKQECSPPQAEPAAASVKEESSLSGASTPAIMNMKSHAPRLGLARALSRSSDSHQQACCLYEEVIAMAPEVHDAYIELANLLVKSDPLAAVDVYSRFPLKPVNEQTFDDAFITGEIVRILMKQELFDHPQLAPNLIAYGKVMGLSCLEKYIDILDGKFMTSLLKTVYAGIHDKSVDDEDLREFFRFKCWI